MAPVSNRQAAEPQEEDLFSNQNIMMLSIAMLCFAMLGAVCIADIRLEKARVNQSDDDLESGSNDGSAKLKGKSISPLETTPLLSSDTTLNGSPSSSSQRSDSGLSLPSPTLDEGVQRDV